MADKNQFIDAPDAEEIAQPIIGEFHPHLVDVPIKYLYRTKARKHGARHFALATASVMGGA